MPTVNKYLFAAMALIAAVPGGFLSYLLVMAMLNHFSLMAGMMKILVCAILALSATVTVLPVGILIFVKSPAEEAEEHADEAEPEEIEALEAGEVADEAQAAFRRGDVVEVTETGRQEPQVIPHAGDAVPDLEQSVVLESDQSAEVRLGEETPPKKPEHD